MSGASSSSIVRIDHFLKGNYEDNSIEFNLEPHPTQLLELIISQTASMKKTASNLIISCKDIDPGASSRSIVRIDNFVKRIYKENSLELYDFQRESSEQNKAGASSS